MPTYDYICDSNGQVVEVKHAMSSEVHSWGELCELAAIDAQGTPLDAPVRRLATIDQSVSWEQDLFGRIGTSIAIAERQADMAAADAHAAMALVQAEVVRHYVLLRRYQAELAGLQAECEQLQRRHQIGRAHV